MSLLADTVNQAIDFFGSGGGVMYPLLLVSLVAGSIKAFSLE